METPTPLENAHTVLEIFGHFKAGVGVPLHTHKFAAIASNLDMPMSDIASGFKFATESGWVEKNADGSFQMTDAGFAEMPK